MSETPLDRPFAALGIRLMAIFFLAVMTAMVKLAGEHGVSLLETMFYRNALSLPLILAFVLAGPGVRSLKTTHMMGHFTRSAVGLIGMVFTFGAYMLLPLAEATTIGFTTPIFATIAAVLFLNEKVRAHRWSAVIIGFIGVLLVTRPGSGSIPLFCACVALGSALIIAIISILLRQLGRTESAITTVFYFASFGALVTGALLGLATFMGGKWSAYSFHMHNHAALVALIGLGISGAIGQVALSASLRYGAVSTIIAMDYSNLIWATIFGWFLFGQLPAPTTWTGAPIIIASGLYIAWREHRRATQSQRV